MGENGVQGKERVVSDVSAFLKNPKKELPVWNGQINVKQLAKDARVLRKNFYENKDVIRLVNVQAKRQGLDPLKFPDERNGNGGDGSRASQSPSKPKEFTVLEREVSRLEKRVVAADNLTRDLTSENLQLQGEKRQLQDEVDRLSRHHYLDELALQGRPVRDSSR